MSCLARKELPHPYALLPLSYSFGFVHGWKWSNLVVPYAFLSLYSKVPSAIFYPECVLPLVVNIQPPFPLPLFMPPLQGREGDQTIF